MGGSGEGQKQMCHLCGWLKKIRAVGFFIFSAAWLSAFFRLAVADNDLKICELADLELQPVDLQQR